MSKDFSDRIKVGQKALKISVNPLQLYHYAADVKNIIEAPEVERDCWLVRFYGPKASISILCGRTILTRAHRQSPNNISRRGGIWSVGDIGEKATVEQVLVGQCFSNEVVDNVSFAPIPLLRSYLVV